MNWETVKIENKNCRSIPYATVGFGRVALNVAACELLGDYGQYNFVEFLKARDNGKTCIGIKFLKEHTPNSIAIGRRRMKDGKLIGGMDISNKGVVESLFGVLATANKSTRYEVKKYEENILGILL